MKMPMRFIITFLVATMSIAAAGPSFAGKKKHHSEKSEKSDKSGKSHKSHKGGGHGHNHGGGSVGPAGPAGADGVDGADGLAGPAGANGIAGAPGVAGADGDDGAVGADGADGADGEDGSSGILTSSVIEASPRTFGGQLGSYTSTASCGVDALASGGGFAMVAVGSGPGTVIESAPTGGSPPTGWRVVVNFAEGDTVGQQFKAYAVCYETGTNPGNND